MILSENFFDVKFADFLPIIAVFISTYLIYRYYKLLDKHKEKRKVIDVFIKLKQDLKFYIPELNKGIVNLGAFEGNLDYYRKQRDYLIKIGVIVKGLEGNLFFPEPILANLKEFQDPMLKILDDYYVLYRNDGAICVWKIKLINLSEGSEKNHLKSVKSVENMFSEMIDYANKYYDMKLKRNLAKLTD